MCSGRVNSSCSTRDSCHVTVKWLVTCWWFSPVPLVSLPPITLTVTITQLKCSGRVNSSCATRDSCHVTNKRLVTGCWFSPVALASLPPITLTVTITQLKVLDGKTDINCIVTFVRRIFCNLGIILLFSLSFVGYDVRYFSYFCIFHSYL